MADWKQITARIRRARTSKDPAGQLSNLFEKTRDAMVAFELARHFETAGQDGDAVKWYSTAAERFRRADWRTKAQEAITRLGGQPAAPEGSTEGSETISLASQVMAVPEPASPFEQSAAVFEAAAASSDAVAAAEPVPPAEPEPAGPPGRRRRGRRGGRGRRRKSPADKPATTRASAPATESRSARPTPAADESVEPRSARSPESPALRLPVESTPDSGGIAARGRFGDPGLSSRLSLLEMQFRRLLSCTPAKLDETASVPAGPGVLLLTDSDLTSYYYVEACQTLRIAVPNILRGGSTRRGADSIKPQLAEHLGIAESRVAKYLADHCVVRWLQLDEGASHFAHFVIAVLRPVLNE
jgi:hypothetical protein